MADTVTAADELRSLIDAADDSDLTDGGRYFSDTCDDLTKCYHGDTGEYQNSADGKLVEWLWNHRKEIADLYTRHRTQSDELREAVELLAEAQGYVACNHDEGCEQDPEYGEAAFNNRIAEEDPDGDLDVSWPKDAKCTCGESILSSRIVSFLAPLRSGR